MKWSFCGLYQQIKKIKLKMWGCVIKVKRKANLRKRAAFKVSFLMPRANPFSLYFETKRRLNLDGHHSWIYPRAWYKPAIHSVFIRTYKYYLRWRKWFTFLLRTRGDELKRFLRGQYSCFKKRIFESPTITIAFCSRPQLLKLLPEKCRKNHLCDSIQKKWGSFTFQRKIRCF